MILKDSFFQGLTCLIEDYQLSLLLWPRISWCDDVQVPQHLLVGTGWDGHWHQCIKMGIVAAKKRERILTSCPLELLTKEQTDGRTEGFTYNRLVEVVLGVRRILWKYNKHGKLYWIDIKQMCYFVLFFLLQHVHSWIKIKEMSPRYQIKIEYCLLTAGLFNVFLSVACLLFTCWISRSWKISRLPPPPVKDPSLTTSQAYPTLAEPNQTQGKLFLWTDWGGIRVTSLVDSSFEVFFKIYFLNSIYLHLLAAVNAI